MRTAPASEGEHSQTGAPCSAEDWGHSSRAAPRSRVTHMLLGCPSCRGNERGVKSRPPCPQLSLHPRFPLFWGALAASTRWRRLGESMSDSLTRPPAALQCATESARARPMPTRSGRSWPKWARHGAQCGVDRSRPAESGIRPAPKKQKGPDARCTNHVHTPAWATCAIAPLSESNAAACAQAVVNVVAAAGCCRCCRRLPPQVRSRESTPTLFTSAL